MEGVIKIIQKLKKYYPLIIAPLLTSAILLYVFSLYGMYPFGQGSVAWCDMNQQGIPLLMDFKDILSGKDGIFLSMQNAGGMNFWGVFCFFLSNPFSFLAALVPKEEMIYFINILVILKLTLSAFTAALYFAVCKERMNGGISVSLSIMYALCGYGMLFYQNIMWLDIMYLFPILMIGLEKLTRQRKNKIYILSLTAIMIMNFYICYMAAMFILLYMAVYLIACRKTEYCPIVCVKFLSGTVIAVLLTAVVWLPSFFQVTSSGRMQSVTDTIHHSNFLSSYHTVLPLLFCTAFIFAVIVLHFFRPENHTPEQKNDLILFALTLVPFLIEPVNIMWHTGNYMSFPARYGFITVFMGLVCCSDLLTDAGEKFSEIKRAKQAIAVPTLILMLFGYSYFSKNNIDKNFDTLTQYTSTLWGNKSSFDGLAELFVITMICYLIIYLLFRKKIIARQIFAVILTAMCILECIGNVRIYMVSPSMNNPSRTETFAEITQLSDKIEDKDFYRVITDYKTADYNMPGALGYPSISHYTSLTDHDFMYMQRLLGYSTVWMKSGSSGGTELTNALYSVKYKIISGAGSQNVVASTGKFSIEELPYYSGLGLICDNSFSECGNIPADLTRAQIQQYIFSEIYHTDKQLIEEYSFDESESSEIRYYDEKYHIQNGAFIKYRFYVAGKQSIYADCFDRFSNALSEEYFGSLNVKVNNQTVTTDYPSADSNGLLKLGEFENETITVEIKSSKNISCYSFGIFGLDLNVLSETIAQSETANLNDHGGKIYGTVYSDKNKTCFLAVPYNDRLIIKINGEIAPCTKTLSDFTAFDLKEGKNDIEITLIPKGFIAGLIMTAIGLFLLIVYLLFGKRLPVNSRIIKAAEWLTAFSAAGAVLMIYVFPIIAAIL